MSSAIESLAPRAPDALPAPANQVAGRAWRAGLLRAAALLACFGLIYLVAVSSLSSREKPSASASPSG